MGAFGDDADFWLKIEFPSIAEDANVRFAPETYVLDAKVMAARSQRRTIR